jgi:hypothetical protein
VDVHLLAVADAAIEGCVDGLSVDVHRAGEFTGRRALRERRQYWSCQLTHRL